MKNKKVVGAVVASALAFALCGGALAGCGNGKGDGKENLTDETLKATKIADYTTGSAADRSAVFPSTGFENGDVFNTFWNEENVSFDNNMAELSLSPMEEKEQVWNPEYDADEAESNPDYDVPEMKDCQANYYGGELRTSKYYGYGDYEVKMKPSSVKGTASTFFVCTGPYDVDYETGEPNKHDEIDIEFLGYDTTFVQFNYFVDGKGEHEYKYNLGFDASKDFHTYGFRWTSEYIVWFVDGKPVHKVKASAKNPMPSTAGRILTNYWTGTERSEAWMGKFEDDFSGKAQYEYIATSAAAQDDPTVAPPAPPVEAPEEGWTGIDASEFRKYTEPYTVSATETEINMSHTVKASGYSCSGMGLASNYSWIKFKVKNNSETDEAYVRVDIKRENPSASGIIGIDSDYEGAEYLNADGAALVKLAAGDTAEVACKIRCEKITVDQLVVFLNSTNGATATAGDITISDIQGITAEDGEAPAPVEESKVLIGTDEVSFTGDGYTVTSSDDKKTMTIAYEDMTGNAYKNVSTNVADIIGENNVFKFKIVNNGSATAKIRIDIGCPVDAVYTGGNYSNLSAKYEGDVESSGNDYQYGGGDWLRISAGGTVTGKIVFKTGVGSDNIKIYVDSAQYDDDTTHTGSVDISDMSFDTEEIETVDPVLPEGEGWTAIDLAGLSAYVPDGGANKFKHESAANGVNIKHDEKPVVSSNLNLAPTYGENNVVHMKIKNNLDIAGKLRINVQSAAAGYKCVITGVTVDGAPLELSDISEDEYNGVTIELAANAEIVVEITINGGDNLAFGLNNMESGAETGDVTISEVAMKVKAAE